MTFIHIYIEFLMHCSNSLRITFLDQCPFNRSNINCTLDCRCVPQQYESCYTNGTCMCYSVWNMNGAPKGKQYNQRKIDQLTIDIWFINFYDILFLNAFDGECIFCLICESLKFSLSNEIKLCLNLSDLQI